MLTRTSLSWTIHPNKYYRGDYDDLETHLHNLHRDHHASISRLLHIL